MPRAPEHIPRLLALVRALVRAKELPIARLCDELDVTEAELRADIELLSLCGLPPYGPDNLIEIQVVGDRVRLSNRVLAPPPLQLSDEEAAGLRMALRIAEDQGWPEKRAPSSAIRKLENALLPERREGARRLASRVRASSGAGGESAGATEDKWLGMVRRAIDQKTSLDIEYYSDGREEVTGRRIDPYRLVAQPRARYVIAYCHTRETVLTFRLDRVLRARRTAARFEPPADLRIEDYVGDKPKDAARMAAVTVRFTPAVARLALESYPDAKPTPDGGALWKGRVWPTLTFCREIVTWGGAAEVIEPAAVRQQVREYAKDLVARYEPSG